MDLLIISVLPNHYVRLARFLGGLIASCLRVADHAAD